MSDLREAIAAGLRKCVPEDGTPVRLIHEADVFHITHMVAEEIAQLFAEHEARPAHPATMIGRR